MSKKVENAVEQVRELVEKLSDPSEMSLRDYQEFLEDVMSDLEGKLDCVNKDLEDEEDI